MIDRLNPKKGSGRYYILSNLKKAIKEIIEEESSFGKILDYGAKDSPYKKLFKAKSISFHTADFKNTGECMIELNDDGTIPVDSNSYDTVISSQVLEHVEDVQLYLSEIKRVLKNDGRLLISTHGYWKFHPDPHDYWRWTREGLIKTLKMNGFISIKTYGIAGLSASGLQLFQDGISQKVPARAKGVFFRLIAFLQKKVDGNRIDNIDSSVYVFFAKLK